ncbi:unnamed protein product, partial [Brenthis ino]
MWDNANTAAGTVESDPLVARNASRIHRSIDSTGLGWRATHWEHSKRWKATGVTVICDRVSRAQCMLSSSVAKIRSLAISTTISVSTSV